MLFALASLRKQTNTVYTQNLRDAPWYCRSKGFLLGWQSILTTCWRKRFLFLFRPPRRIFSLLSIDKVSSAAEDCSSKLSLFGLLLPSVVDMSPVALEKILHALIRNEQGDRTQNVFPTKEAEDREMKAVKIMTIATAA